MKNSKKEKTVYICYIIASVSFYIAAIIEFFGNKTNMGVIHLCLGSTFLCLSSVYRNK